MGFPISRWTARASSALTSSLGALPTWGSTCGVTSSCTAPWLVAPRRLPRPPFRASVGWKTRFRDRRGYGRARLHYRPCVLRLKPAPPSGDSELFILYLLIRQGVASHSPSLHYPGTLPLQRLQVTPLPDLQHSAHPLYNKSPSCLAPSPRHASSPNRPFVWTPALDVSLVQITRLPGLLYWINAC